LYGRCHTPWTQLVCADVLGDDGQTSADGSPVLRGKGVANVLFVFAAVPASASTRPTKRRIVKISSLAKPQGGVDAMAGLFPSAKPVPGITDNGDAATTYHDTQLEQFDRVLSRSSNDLLRHSSSAVDASLRQALCSAIRSGSCG